MGSAINVAACANATTIDVHAGPSASLAVLITAVLPESRLRHSTGRTTLGGSIGAPATRLPSTTTSLMQRHRGRTSPLSKRGASVAGPLVVSEVPTSG